MTELSAGALNALRSTLEAEHAAVWVYGLSTAFAEDSGVSTTVDDALVTHKSQRDELHRLIRDGGHTPPSAQTAYATPEEVTDQSSAMRALVTTEEDCQVGWRSVLENTEDPTTRQVSLDGLTTSAVRATRLRLALGEQPGATAFPGQPN